MEGGQGRATPHGDIGIRGIVGAKTVSARGAGVCQIARLAPLRLLAEMAKGPQVEALALAVNEVEWRAQSESFVSEEA